MPFKPKKDYSNEKLAENLEKLASQGQFGAKLGEALKEQKYRKLNRIASNLDKLKHNDPQLGKVSTALNEALQAKVDNPSAEPNWEATKAAMRGVFSDGEKPSDLQKQNRGIMLPLNHWISDERGPDPDVEKGLREYRLDVQRNDEMIPIAIHRGDGPTFKTMGIEIAKDNHKFTNFEAENTSAAFEKAREQMHGKPAKDISRVNGLETDVFLTHDGEVVLTHDADVEVQLDEASRTKELAAREARIADPELAKKLEGEKRLDALSQDVTTFQMRRKESLDGMQVRADNKTQFIGLKTFIEKINDAGKEHLAETGKLAKAEIEMKGHYSRVKGGNPPWLDKLTKKEELKNGYKEKLMQEVTKELSQANKKALAGFSSDENPSMNAVPVRVALFNGSFEDSQKFDQARRTKTSLFNVQVGVGQGKAEELEKLKPLDSEEYVGLDELRTGSGNLEQMHGLLPPDGSRALAPHVTFVSRGDRIPSEDVMNSASTSLAKVNTKIEAAQTAYDEGRTTKVVGKRELTEEKRILELDTTSPAKLKENQLVAAYHQEINKNVSLLIDSSANVGQTRSPTTAQIDKVKAFPSR